MKEKRKRETRGGARPGAGRKKSENALVPVSAQISKETHAAMKEVAEKAGTSVSGVARWALEEKFGGE